jgi:hypothetical protein
MYHEWLLKHLAGDLGFESRVIAGEMCDHGCEGSAGRNATDNEAFGKVCLENKGVGERLKGEDGRSAHGSKSRPSVNEYLPI